MSLARRRRSRPAGRAGVVTLAASVALIGAATVVTAPPAAAANSTSTTSASVVPSLAPAATHVGQAVFVVPTATCRSTADQILGVSIGMLPSLSGGGSDLLFGQLQVSCDGGQPTYQVTAQNGRGEQRSGPVAPGDQLQVLVRVTTDRATVNILDLTSGVTVYATGPGFTATVGVVGVGAGFGQGVFPDFGRVQFSDVSFDGVALGRISSRQSYDQVQGTRIIAKTGPVKGGSFEIVQRGQYKPPAG